ncbi:MAG: T9SS type A sorting domain-containing protein [Paludibacteraceae bacterium]|nr:T9SS type A sorting domain-containing protein [Paludibacteraceae bacterium]
MHPLRPQATALWMDVVSLSGRPSSVRETADTTSDKAFRLWPNPTPGPVSWHPDALEYRLTDLQGHLLQSGTGGQAQLPPTPGCYLIHLRRSDGWETHKIIRLP